jgi:OmcA/MtrC family decaheme c-type cytochrome
MKPGSALLVVALVVGGVASACSGDEGEPGPQGPPGEPGAGAGGVGGTAGSGATGGLAGSAGTGGVPGLPGDDFDLTILAAEIGEDGVPEVIFSVTDAAGGPLAIGEGGVGEPRFVLGYLTADSLSNPSRYVPLTTTTQTSPVTNRTGTLPAADAGGTFTPVAGSPGRYVYRFGSAVAVADRGATHTVGAWGARTLDGIAHVDNALLSFVPSGGDPVVRQLVSDAACNTCHGQLEAHGGQRRDVQLCTICHTAGFEDPDTGNSIDFRVMVHKIHRGAELPSVQAGEPYRLIGFQGSVHDYSKVVFPQAIENCSACHQGAQADRWETHPTRSACGACHDRTAFTLPAPAGFEPHPGTEQLTDADCAVCHKPSGFAPIDEVHRIPELDPGAPEVGLSIVSVTNTAPGQTPELLFTASVDGRPRDLIAAPLTRIAVTLAGPTTDYASFVTYVIQGTGARGTLSADGDAFRYVFPEPIPAEARGSYAVGMEGFLQPDPPSGPRYAAFNPVAYFAVTDPAPVARREIVAQQACNSCHRELSAHGGQRKNVEYCVFCHLPGNANDDRIARVEGTTVVAHSVNLKPMVHSIHMGERLTQPFVLGTFPIPNRENPLGGPHDFSEVRYPRNPADCSACHLPGTTALPLAAGLLPSRSETLICTEDPAADDDTYCDTRTVIEMLTPPESSACVSCHDSPATKAHAELMTTATGVESCATCHAPGSSFDAEAAHAEAVRR